MFLNTWFYIQCQLIIKHCLLICTPQLHCYRKWCRTMTFCALEKQSFCKYFAVVDSMPPAHNNCVRLRVSAIDWIITGNDAEPWRFLVLQTNVFEHIFLHTMPINNKALFANMHSAIALLPEMMQNHDVLWFVTTMFCIYFAAEIVCYHLLDWV